MDQVFLPLQLTMLKLVEEMTIPYSNEVALQIPLKQSECTFEQLRYLHQILWTGADHIPNAKRQFL